MNALALLAGLLLAPSMGPSARANLLTLIPVLSKLTHIALCAAACRRSPARARVRARGSGEPRSCQSGILSATSEARALEWQRAEF